MSFLEVVAPLFIEGVKFVVGSAVIGGLFALTGEAVHEVVRKIKEPGSEVEKPKESDITDNIPIMVADGVNNIKTAPINIQRSKKRNGDNHLLDDLIKQLNRKVYKDPSIIKKY